MNEPLRILLLADYSNFHNTLSKGLRNMGCDVTVISDGTTFMNTTRDYDISRSPGKLGGLKLYLRLKYSMRKHLRGYDIVSLRDPTFLELQPKRNLEIFNRLKRDNPNIFLTALTTDAPFLDMLEAADSPLRYSEWFVEGKPNRLMLEESGQWATWHGADMLRLNEAVYSGIDGAVAALYEYHKGLERKLSPEKIAYGGIPVDVDNIRYSEPGGAEKIRIFLGRDRRRKLIKGSDFLEYAARKVCDKYPGKAELVIIENVSREEYNATMESCDVVLDQIYSYTPATAALEAMAMGKTVVSGAEPEYYDFIGEQELHPIINAPIEIEPLSREIEEIILHPERMAQRAREGRAFVKRHNDMNIVAGRFLEFWKKRLAEKGYRQS